MCALDAPAVVAAQLKRKPVRKPNLTSHLTRAIATVLVAAATLLACVDTPDVAQVRPCCVSFADFEPTDDERDEIFRLVEDLKRERDHEGAVFDGVIYRFSNANDSPRYLLVLGDDQTREILLHVFEPSESDPISPVFPTGVIYNEYNFEPLAVADFDGDGFPDFGYCSWSDGVAEANRTVVGFSNQSWHRVVEYASLPPECGPGGSP